MLISNLPVNRNFPNLFESWMTLIFFIIFILFAYIKVNYGKKFEQIFNSVLRLGYLRQIMREEQVTTQRSSISLNIVFILMLGLFLYEFFVYKKLNIFEKKGILLYLLCILALSILYFGKYLVIKFFESLFQYKEPLEEYLYNTTQINKTIGILLFPILIVCTFINKDHVHLFFISVVIALTILIILRLLRGLAIGFSYNVSKLYIILYLCTVELIPFILLVKVVFI
jgi:hypothetical protein